MSREEGHDLHAPGKAVGNGRQREQVGGAGEQKAAGTPILVDGQLDRAKQFRCSLNLVQDGAVERTQEPCRVIARCGQCRLIVQADVPPPIHDEAAHRRGLAALARSVDHYHRCIRKRGCHLPGGMARNEGIVGC